MGFDAVRPAGLAGGILSPLHRYASDAKLCMGMSLRANTIHCMRTLTGLLARIAAAAVAVSSLRGSLSLSLKPWMCDFVVLRG